MENRGSSGPCSNKDQVQWLDMTAVSAAQRAGPLGPHLKGRSPPVRVGRKELSGSPWRQEASRRRGDQRYMAPQCQEGPLPLPLGNQERRSWLVGEGGGLRVQRGPQGQPTMARGRLDLPCSREHPANTPKPTLHPARAGPDRPQPPSLHPGQPEYLNDGPVAVLPLVLLGSPLGSPPQALPLPLWRLRCKERNGAEVNGNSIFLYIPLLIA